MTALIPFHFEGRSVRVVKIDGEPWFVGKDVAEAIGYADTTNAIKQHCKGVAKHHPLATAGGMQEVRVLSEPDVLRLIVKSGLPAADKFERLVFEEILPTIRKTGSYSIRPTQPTEVAAQAARLFPPFFRIARLIGCDKPAAAISANQAVQTVAGTNILALMGRTHIKAENQGAQYYTPTELCRRAGVSAPKFNQLLANAGFQVRLGKKWDVTDAGRPYARIYDTGKKHNSGAPVQQVKWAASVVDVIRPTPPAAQMHQA